MADIGVTLGTTEITVDPQPYRMQRQYHGFAGANGLTALAMGSRGRVAVVTGVLRAASRALLANVRVGVEDLQLLGAADYTWLGEAFPSAVWEDFRLVPERGRIVHRVADGTYRMKFQILLRCLV